MMVAEENSQKIKIGICAHFALKKNDCRDGQTIKSRALMEAMQKKCGENSVDLLDTFNWTEKKFNFFVDCLKLAYNNTILIVLPGRNGLITLLPLFILFKFLFKNKVYYDVVGGWLPGLVKNKPLVKFFLKLLDGIWVETNTMKTELSNFFINNVNILNNFRTGEVLEESELRASTNMPYKLVYYSRLLYQKGLEDLIDALTAVNSFYAIDSKLAFTLDIYGPMEKGCDLWFENIKKKFPNYIRFCGCVDPSYSVITLKNYDYHAFPTRFITEGIPGAIVEGYFAGVPVLASRWQSATDVIDEGKTGFIYEFGNKKDLAKLLIKIASSSAHLKNMKIQCLKKAQLFTARSALEKIWGFIS